MGSSVTVPEEVMVAPTLTVELAVLEAARHDAAPHPDEQGTKDCFGEPMSLPTVDLEGFEPRIIATFAKKSERPAVLEAGPVGVVSSTNRHTAFDSSVLFHGFMHGVTNP